MPTQKITPFAAAAQITRAAINSLIGIINEGLTVLDNRTSNIDNTSDENKPVSIAQQAALLEHTSRKDNPHEVTAADVGAHNTNLLRNPHFTINQRGTAGVFSDVGQYPIDGYKLTAGTVTVNANKTLTLNGTLIQIREEPLGVDFVADVYCTSGTATASYDDSTKVFTLTSSGGTAKAVSLEEGLVATLKNADGSLRRSPPDPQQELARCQRHQLAVEGNARMRCTQAPTDYIDFWMPIPTTLRAIPLLVGTLEVRFLTGIPQTGFTFSVPAISSNGILIRAAKAAHGLSDGYIVATTKVILDSNIY